MSKTDPSLRSFLFTLKNPHNFPVRKFGQTAEKKDFRAIFCRSDVGPSFSDIGVDDNCNLSTDNHTSDFDYSWPSYANDTGLDGTTFFTGDLDFRVKEVEVFEITD
jgi:hypothetical protein